MTLRLVIAPAAERDLADILEFISQDNVSAARKTVLRIERAIGRLLERPFLGPAVIRPKRTGPPQNDRFALHCFLPIGG
jgi:plasmid stabilization system protein ParE